MEKNILFLRTNISGGGPTTLLLSTINVLSKRGYHFTVIAGGGTQLDRIRALGVPCYEIKNLLVSERKLSKHLASIREIRRIIKEEKISIIYGFEASTTALAYVASRMMGRKIKIASAVLGDGKEWFKRIVPFKLACMSQTQKDFLVQCGVRPGKVSVVYPSTLDAAKFTATEEQVKRFREELGLNAEDVLIGAVMMGGKGSKKVVDILEPVLRETPRAHMVFVGTSTRYDLYRELLEGTCVREQVHFVGARSDIPVVMAGMDILLHAIGAGEHETFGMVLTEAMFMKTAVVATELGGMVEIINNGENGYLARPDDVEQFQGFLRTLINNRELRETMAEKGRQTALEKFTDEKMADSLEQVFSQL